MYEIIDLDNLDFPSPLPLIPSPGDYVLRVRHVVKKEKQVFLEDADQVHPVATSRLYSQFRTLLGDDEEEWSGQEVLALCAILLTRNGKWHESYSARQVTQFVKEGWRPSLLVKRIIRKEQG